MDILAGKIQGGIGMSRRDSEVSLANPIVNMTAVFLFIFFLMKNTLKSTTFFD